MKRILFVDDETRILDGLRRMLRSMRNEWEMVFASSGEVAMAELAAAPFDVIVTDMRMPGMDGAALLQLAQKKHPDVVRIVLSGYSEMEAALRAVPVAHQFLSKPCSSDVVREVVDRACGLRELLTGAQLCHTIGGMTSLPSLPKAYSALAAALANPDTSVRDIATLVERDIGLSAKMLQLVNSSFFGLPHRVANVQSAITYLGVTMVRNLALSAEVFGALQPKGSAALADALYEHATLAGGIARRLAPDKQQSEDAFMAGVLHDAGKLVLASRLPDAFAAAMTVARDKHCPLHVAELELLGTTHAEVGAYLLGLWGLPYPIIEAVAHHHAPLRVKPMRFDVLGAVHVANVLALECAALRTGATCEAAAELNVEYLRALGVEERLPGWREMAASVATAPGGGL
ncbi:MAG: hypothetical protein A3K19_31195 [Lentisphaerae bacterium RIFOXYB12_FULL_65_16]|nr:MAG: hypothetical protein A3K18_20485 [Lentisphaerae bacterium RIFOXYA12_64_32]OGV88903.1 MAG: hypothetical protein A3K19_31195 [Lentisphaerae bacterium RIFOXYB12_FULL_65_16]